MDAKGLRDHLNNNHRTTITQMEVETLVARNTMYVSREPTECPLCSEDILNTVERQSPFPTMEAVSSKDASNPSETSNETEPGIKQRRYHHYSDEEIEEVGLTTTDASSATDEHSQELSNQAKMMMHIGRHLKSLAFVSLRYFDTEDVGENGSANSYGTVFGGDGKKGSSQGQNWDQYFEVDDSLNFEDIPPEKRPSGYMFWPEGREEVNHRTLPTTALCNFFFFVASSGDRR